MYPDETYRAFLLGTADAETEAGVEEEILDGRVAPDHLRQIEDELIDDLLFGRLSTEEESLFRRKLLASHELATKLEFARALQEYAVRSAPAAVRTGFLVRLREWAATPWVLPLAGALGCAVLGVVWLGERTRGLDQELALATQTNIAQQRTIASMAEEQKRRDAQPDISTTHAADSKPATTAAVQPMFRLTPGVSRGIARVPVLSLNQHASVASIVLELPFDVAGTLREELRGTDDKVVIWSQEFSVAGSVVDHGVTTVAIPATLLPSGEYHLHVEAGASGEDKAGYQFRVFRN